jgi:acid phosphatase
MPSFMMRPLSGLALAVAILTAAGSMAPASDSGLAFVVMGDWGNGRDGQKAVAVSLAQRAGEIGAKFVITTGDNFYPRGVRSTTDKLWRTRFEDVYTPPALQVPWLVALGNHDHRGSINAEIQYTKISPRWRLSSPFYRHSEWLDSGGRVDFFFLDTTPLYHASRLPWKLWPFGSRQYAWLEHELAVSTADWKFVIGHHPVFSGGGHGNTDALVRKLKPLLERYGVQAYFNGHNHILEHIVVDGIHYLTSGAGAGAESKALRPVAGTLAAFGVAGFMTVTVRTDVARVEFVDATANPLYRTEIQRSMSKSAVHK